jgi:hypothetical protein
MTSHGLRCAAGKTALHGMGEMRRPSDLVRFANFAGAMIEFGCLGKYLREFPRVDYVILDSCVDPKTSCKTSILH